MKWVLKGFEELSSEEIYDILMLRNEVFIVEQNCPYQDCDGRDKYSYHLYLEDESNMAAYLRILKKGVSFKEVSIGRVLVKKDYRGRNISREMLLKAINFVHEEMGEKEIRISAQAYLLNFYKSFGFKEVSEIYLEDDIPHIEMLLK